jgi:hypothetical protein
VQKRQREVPLDMKKIFTVLLCLLCVGSAGCGTATQTQGEADSSYAFGIISTSNTHPQSQIQLYSEQGTILRTIDLKAGGLQKAVSFGDKLYIPVIGSQENPDGRIIEFDKRSAAVRYIDTGLFPLRIATDGTYVFAVLNSAMDQETVAKIDIERNQTVKEVNLNGVLGNILVDGHNLYVTGDLPQTNEQYVYRLSEDLNVMDVVKNPESIATTDLCVENGALLLANSVRHSNDVSHELVKVNLRGHSLQSVKLALPAPYQIFQVNNRTVLTHYFFPTNSGDAVTVVNNLTGQQETYELGLRPFQSLVKGTDFYTLDSSSHKLAVFDTVNFRKKKEYTLSADENMVVEDFFVN